MAGVRGDAVVVRGDEAAQNAVTMVHGDVVVQNVQVEVDRDAEVQNEVGRDAEVQNEVDRDAEVQNVVVRDADVHDDHETVHDGVREVPYRHSNNFVSQID